MGKQNTGTQPQDIELEGLDQLDRNKETSRSVKPTKSTARASYNTHSDAEGIPDVEVEVDREVFPDGDEDTHERPIDDPDGLSNLFQGTMMMMRIKSPTVMCSLASTLRLPGYVRLAWLDLTRTQKA